MVIIYTKPNNSIKDRGAVDKSTVGIKGGFAEPVHAKGETAEGIRRKVSWVKGVTAL